MKPIAILVLLSSFSQHFTRAHLCPDHKQSCPEWTTCCELVDGSYGCCPFIDAQCCPDKIHCCPSGTKCNMRKQTCDSSSLGVPFRWMVAVYDREIVSKSLGKPVLTEPDTKVNVAVVKCPDGKTCPEKYTCCQMPPGNYGCCPYTNAMCCGDKQHCCPSGYNCDMQRDRCIIKSFLPNSFYTSKPKYTPIYNIKTEEFEAPTKFKSSCSTSNECSRAGYVCCSAGDLDYCCPSGTVCSTRKGFCVIETKVEVQALNFSSLNNVETDEVTQMEKSRDNVCPDGNKCGSLDTCCPLQSGDYGCCPLPEATCCPDKLHCCPNGYVCDDDGFCEKTPLFNLFDERLFTQRNFVDQPRF